jgi:hypothetical protein
MAEAICQTKFMNETLRDLLVFGGLLSASLLAGSIIAWRHRRSSCWLILAVGVALGVFAFLQAFLAILSPHDR